MALSIRPVLGIAIMVIENTEIAQGIEQKIRAALGIGEESSEGADIVDLDPAAGEAS